MTACVPAKAGVRDCACRLGSTVLSQWELTAPRHVCRTLRLAGTRCCSPSFRSLSVHPGIHVLWQCRTPLQSCLFLVHVGLLIAVENLQNEETGSIGITGQGGTQHVWGLDVGRSQAVCPRKFLLLVEQGQEEKCSGCFSTAAAPCLTYFMAADFIQNVSCRHDAPSAPAPEQSGMDGQGQNPCDP